MPRRKRKARAAAEMQVVRSGELQVLRRHRWLAMVPAPFDGTYLYIVTQSSRLPDCVDAAVRLGAQVLSDPIDPRLTHWILADGAHFSDLSGRIVQHPLAARCSVVQWTWLEASIQGGRPLPTGPYQIEASLPFFRGLVLLFHGYEDLFGSGPLDCAGSGQSPSGNAPASSSIIEAVTRAGATIVPKDAPESMLATVTYVISQVQDAFVTSMACQGRRIATLFWLADAARAKDPCLPTQHPLHRPRPSLHLPSMVGRVVSISGYVGREREEIKAMLVLMGATYSGFFSATHSFLVAADTTSTKYVKAIEWRVPAVSKAWVEDCFAQWRDLDPEPYAMSQGVPPRSMSSAAQTDPVAQTNRVAQTDPVALLSPTAPPVTESELEALSIPPAEPALEPLALDSVATPPELPDEHLETKSPCSPVAPDAPENSPSSCADATRPLSAAESLDAPDENDAASARPPVTKRTRSSGKKNAPLREAVIESQLSVRSPTESCSETRASQPRRGRASTASKRRSLAAPEEEIVQAAPSGPSSGPSSDASAIPVAPDQPSEASVHKRRRAAAVLQAKSQDEAIVAATAPAPVSSHAQAKTSLSVEVMATGLGRGDASEADVATLGGTWTELMRPSTTHLLVGRMARTAKLLQAIARGLHIVGPSWLADSVTHGTWADPTAHLPLDVAFERRYRFELVESLRRARTAPLYRGVCFVLDTVFEPESVRDTLRDLITLQEGMLLDSEDQLPKALPRGTLLIVDKAAGRQATRSALARRAKALGARLEHQEYVFLSTLVQSLDVSGHEGSE